MSDLAKRLTQIGESALFQVRQSELLTQLLICLVNGEENDTITYTSRKDTTFTTALLLLFGLSEVTATGKSTIKINITQFLEIFRKVKGSDNNRKKFRNDLVILEDLFLIYDWNGRIRKVKILERIIDSGCSTVEFKFDETFLRIFAPDGDEMNLPKSIFATRKNKNTGLEVLIIWRIYQLHWLRLDLETRNTLCAEQLIGLFPRKLLNKHRKKSSSKQGVMTPMLRILDDLFEYNIETKHRPDFDTDGDIVYRMPDTYQEFLFSEITIQWSSEPHNPKGDLAKQKRKARKRKGK